MYKLRFACLVQNPLVPTMYPQYIDIHKTWWLFKHYKLFYKVHFLCQGNCPVPLAPTVALETVCPGKLLSASQPVKVQLWRAGAMLFPWKLLVFPPLGAL